MITGATDGIGKGIALELAKKRKNLILLGRNSAKLESVKNEIMEKYGMNCKTLLYDFSKPQVFELDDLPEIGMLINNAGINPKPPTRLEDYEHVNEIIMVNTINLVKLTQCILKKMRNGYVINTGSIYGEWIVPLMACYCGTKSFLRNLMFALHYESSIPSLDTKIPSNNHVEYVNTGYVCTKLSGIKNSSYFCPSYEAYAKNYIKTIGSLRESIPYYPHLLWKVFFSLLPMCITAKYLRRRTVNKRNKAFKESKKD